MYMGSSIYGPGVGDLSEKFGISQVAASLGITVFVMGYAVGPVSLFFVLLKMNTYTGVLSSDDSIASQ